MQEAQSYAIKQQALQEQLALYQKAGQDRVKQAQEVQNQLKQLEADHTASEKQLDDQMRAANRQTYVRHGLTASQSLIQIAQGHQSLAATVQSMHNKDYRTYSRQSLKRLSVRRLAVGPCGSGGGRCINADCQCSPRGSGVGRLRRLPCLPVPWLLKKAVWCPVTARVTLSLQC